MKTDVLQAQTDTDNCPSDPSVDPSMTGTVRRPSSSLESWFFCLPDDFHPLAKTSRLLFQAGRQNWRAARMQMISYAEPPNINNMSSSWS
jgi:hypothetical protein